VQEGVGDLEQAGDVVIEAAEDTVDPKDAEELADVVRELEITDFPM